MKKAIAVAALIFLLPNCQIAKDRPAKIETKITIIHDEVIQSTHGRTALLEIEYDGCRYLISDGRGEGFIHKANCNNPFHAAGNPRQAAP